MCDCSVAVGGTAIAQFAFSFQPVIELPARHRAVSEVELVGAHGDAIRFLTDSRGLAFMDAVKELADQAGMEVPAPDPRAQAKADKKAKASEVPSDRDAAAERAAPSADDDPTSD